MTGDTLLKLPRGPLKTPIGYTHKETPNSYTKTINKPSSIRRKVYTFIHIELHSDSLRDIEKLTDLVIGEPLANVTLIPFSLIFARNITSSTA